MDIPDTYYRVSVKALISDEQHRLLVVKNDKGSWEMPGGGLEHHETFEQCLQRELQEELDATISVIGNVAFCYGGKTRNGHPKLNIAIPVSLTAGKLTPGDEMTEARYVTQAEFLELAFEAGEETVQPFADQIWQQTA